MLKTGTHYPYYPYTEEMTEAKVQPHPSSIFKWGKNQPGCNLVTVSKKELIMTLLPRTNARFTRQGLIVFGLRYDSKERDFTEEYLTGGDAIAAYNPESADKVYLHQESGFIEFHLIESRFIGTISILGIFAIRFSILYLLHEILMSLFLCSLFCFSYEL